MSEVNAERRDPITLAIVAAVGLLGLVTAARTGWIGDDAYISIRYAENLVAGHGLVFNRGERVEGITNLLWTLWIALGVRLGIPPAPLAIYGGAACFGGTCAVLAWIGLRDRPDRPDQSDQADHPGQTPAHPVDRVPWAGLALALMPDAIIWGTSGLETAALMLALVSAYALVTRRGGLGGPRPLVAAVLTGVAAGLRPDGVLMAPVLFVALWWLGPRDAPRWRAPLLYAAGVSAVWIPMNAARIAYYGDFFPNTYYAKGADESYWSQGWLYVRTYYERYGGHLFALPLLALAWQRATASPTPESDARVPATVRPLVGPTAALAFAALYTTYVAKVGGDFMYARLLIPTAPALLLALGAGLRALAPWPRLGLGLAIIALPWLLPSPLTQRVKLAGIEDEHAFYTNERAAWIWRERSEAARHYFEGTGARVVFMGTFARTVRDAGIDPAIEGETGLTDAATAHRPTGERGRPGHEKRPDPFYLADERKVHFAFGRSAYELLELWRVVPMVTVVLPNEDGPSVDLTVIRWDPTLMAELERRGAALPDLDAMIQTDLRRLPTLEPEVCRDRVAQLRRLYFDQQPDAPGAEQLDTACP